MTSCRQFLFAVMRLAVAVAFLGTGGWATAQTKDTITAAFSTESTTMDPTRYGAAADLFYISQMFEMLARPDADGKMIPWLAESWALTTENGKPVIDIRLRKDVKFHNGDPLTSADLEFGYERARDPKISRLAQRYAKIDRFEIVDPYRFKLYFKEPDGSFIVQGLQMYAVPKKYYQQVGEEGFGKAPVGTGPWKFVSRTVKDELRLTAFPDYWNKQQRPTVKNLVIKIIPEDLTRVAAFKTGQVDWIDGVPPPLVKEFKSMKGAQTFSAPSGNHLFFDFPAYDKNSPFSKLEVRKAVAHGFDMDTIISSVLYGQGKRYTGVGLGNAGVDPALQPYKYDPALAKSLLAKAGYPNGFDTPCYNMTTQREPNIKEMGEAVFAYLQTIGIRCQVVGLEYGAWVTKIRRGAEKPLDGIITTMSAQSIPADPGAAWTLALHSYKPNTGFGSYSQTSDAKADEMVEQMQATMDPVERNKIMRDLARYKHENVLSGVVTYEPIITMAWRDTIEFKPWSSPGYWHAFQQIGYKK